MTILIIIAAALVLLVLLMAIAPREAKEKVATNNKNFEVELLFEVDGCKVYRFCDAGRDVYFVNCQGSTSWEDRRGKSTEEIEVSTNQYKKTFQ
jgi:hypothetical protein